MRPGGNESSHAYNLVYGDRKGAHPMGNHRGQPAAAPFGASRESMTGSLA